MAPNGFLLQLSGTQHIIREHAEARQTPGHDQEEPTRARASGGFAGRPWSTRWLPLRMGNRSRPHEDYAVQ
jgi:hypothetical protein